MKDSQLQRQTPGTLTRILCTSRSSASVFVKLTRASLVVPQPMVVSYQLLKMTEYHAAGIKENAQTTIILTGSSEGLLPLHPSPLLRLARPLQFLLPVPPRHREDHCLWTRLVPSKSVDVACKLLLHAATTILVNLLVELAVCYYTIAGDLGSPEIPKHLF